LRNEPDWERIFARNVPYSTRFAGAAVFFSNIISKRLDLNRYWQIYICASALGGVGSSLQPPFMGLDIAREGMGGFL
jgi:hypothetical protein